MFLEIYGKKYMIRPAERMQEMRKDNKRNEVKKIYNKF